MVGNWALSHLLFRFPLFDWILVNCIRWHFRIHFIAPAQFCAPENERMALKLLGFLLKISMFLHLPSFVHDIGSLDLLGVILQIPMNFSFLWHFWTIFCLLLGPELLTYVFGDSQQNFLQHLHLYALLSSVWGQKSKCL